MPYRSLKGFVGRPFKVIEGSGTTYKGLEGLIRAAKGLIKPFKVAAAFQHKVS